MYWQQRFGICYLWHIPIFKYTHVSTAAQRVVVSVCCLNCHPVIAPTPCWRQLHLLPMIYLYHPSVLSVHYH